MPKLRLPAFELHYEVNGAGPAVVYIHGGFPSLAMRLRTQDPFEWTWEWDFARKHRFVWYDRRACYRSTIPSDGFDLEKQAEDLRALLDHLAIAEAHLIGSSAGGPIGILFAAKHPERVTSLVLAGSALQLFPADDPQSRIVRQQVQRLETDGARAAYENRPEGVEACLDPLWQRPQAEAEGKLEPFMEAQKALARQVEKIPLETRISLYAIELRSVQATMEADTTRHAAEIRVPTLVLHGTEDWVVPVEWARSLADTIPGSTLKLLNGGIHGLIPRDPTARRLVIAFMRGHQGGSYRG
jgi:pimeloyl-ACP methyl ester carboxylesterase